MKVGSHWPFGDWRGNHPAQKRTRQAGGRRPGSRRIIIGIDPYRLPEVVHKRVRRNSATHRPRFKLSGTARSSCVSCSIPFVVIQQSAQQRVSLDDFAFVGRRRGLSRADWHGGGISHGQRSVVFALMRPEPVVVGDVLGRDVVELPKTEANQVVQTVPLKTADPRLGVAIRDGSLDGCRHDSRPVLPE